MTSAEPELEGVLPVDKPVGPTSHDIVAAARRALRLRRIGHTGTLDPFASGLLLLCLGRATRLAEYLSGMDKRYSATVRFGISTDTDDHTGRTLQERDASGLSCAQLEAAAATLRGPLRQRPPVYSAKQRAGKRAYQLARAGVAVDLEEVDIVVHELTVTRCAPPEADLEIHSSSGTYIRAIARDLGELLGTGAHLAALRRTAVGSHRVERAVSVDDLADPERVRSVLLSPLDALAMLPRVELDGAAVTDIRSGRAVRAATGVRGTVALAADGQLIAIADADAAAIRPRKVFL